MVEWGVCGGCGLWLCTRGRGGGEVVRGTTSGTAIFEAGGGVARKYLQDSTANAAPTSQHSTQEGVLDYCCASVAH